MKISKLINKKYNYPKYIKGKCLFYIDIKSKYAFFDYDIIWIFIESNYSSDSECIKKFIIKCVELFQSENYLVSWDTNDDIPELKEKNKLSLCIDFINYFDKKV
jgi:hypothetical protein